MGLSVDDLRELSGVTPRLFVPLSQRRKASGGAKGGDGASFEEMLTSAVRAVRAAQEQAAAASAGLARGEGELHRVLIAVQQAQLTLELTAAVRNKVLEAYQELSRMQV